uniref:Keratin n=1 Tax=Athene cunicularia TaxID=194338 RepID=A0A663M658_ATHCN
VTRRMSCYSESCRPCGVTCPQPIAESYNEPCVQQCPDSRAVIFPPPAVVTMPGPILSSFPQESVVGSSGPPTEVALAEPSTAAPLPAEVTGRLEAAVEKLAPQVIARPEPRCAPKYSYTYSSQWTHPCNSYRSGKRWTY